MGMGLWVWVYRRGFMGMGLWHGFMGMESCQHRGRETESGILAYEARLWGLPMGAESCLYRKRAEDGISPTGNIKTQTLAFPRRRGLLSRLIQKSAAVQAHPRGRGLSTHAERPDGTPANLGGSCVYRQANSTS